MSCENCSCDSCKNDNNNNRTYDKWRYTLYTTILFFIVVNPLTYNLTNSLLKPFVKISSNGCPTIYGIVIHGIVFTLLLRYMMELNI